MPTTDAPNIERILNCLRGVVKSQTRPDTYHAYCPLHKGGNERNRSLSIWIGRDGRILIGCHVCGYDSKRDILQAMGLTMSDLFRDSPDNVRERPRRKIVAKFRYQDEGGNVLYEVLRTEPKGFLQRRPGKNGAWEWGLGEGTRRVLYRLPTIVANPNHPVLVVEGEGKVDLLLRLGLIATCNVGGCGMGWCDSYSQSLAKRRCVILPDNNMAGQKHADIVCGSLIRNGAASVRVVSLPGLPPDGDVVDWWQANKDLNLLLSLLKGAREWRPTT